MKNRNYLSVRLSFFGVMFCVILAGISTIAFVSSWGNSRFPVLIFFCSAFLVFCILAYFFLWKPYRKTTHIVGLFASRIALDDTPPLRCPYNAEMQFAMERLKEYAETSTASEVSKRQAQYMALQSQINPHFLYNTLESVRSEALMSGLDSVADMCEALATFFRYTISNSENLVTIEEEIQNIQIYFYIQQYRFGNRLHLDIDYADVDRDIIQKCKIPKLTLQPIIENAIIHGIEKKIGDGTVTIRLQLTEKRLLITISDNGVGINRESLDRINRNMIDRSVTSKDGRGIAISNVNNRFKILFGEEYGVNVFSTVGVGTDVEITLPYEAK